MSQVEAREGATSVDPGEAPASPRRRIRGILVAGFAGSGVLYLVMASLSSRITEIPLSAQLGPLQLLPGSYWVGIGLVGLSTALALREGSDALVVATGSLLLGLFAVTPNLFEPNPRYWDGYMHLDEAQAVLSTGHLPPGELGEYSANWPGFFLLFSMLLSTIGIPPMIFLAVFPFLSGGLTFLTIFVFLRSTFPQSVAAPGAILASLFAVWAQFHVSPQSLGFVLILLVLAVLWRRETRWRLGGAVLFVGLVVSHPTSTLILLVILVVASVFGFVWGRRSAEAKEDSRYTRRVTAAYATTWLAWLFFQARGSSDAAQTAILTRMGALINLPEETLNLATARTVENLFPLAPLLRFGAIAVYAGIGLVALVLLRRKEAFRPLARFLFAGVVGLGSVGAADILGFGGQFYDRCLLLFATLAPAMCLTGLGTIRLPKLAHHGILAILLAAAVAAASTAYYHEAFNRVPDESVAMSQFLQRAPPGSLVLDGFFPVPVWIDPADRTSLARVDFFETYPVPLGSLASSPATYAVFDPTAELWYRQWRGLEVYRFYDAERAEYSRIYDNGRGAIYILEG